MKNKNFIIYILTFCWLGGLVAACSQEEGLPEEVSATGGFVFTVTPPELKGMNTRALFPLEPEMENPIKNLALLVFDKEGTHVIEHSDYYIFHQYANEENPTGLLQVLVEKYPGKLPATDTVTLCAVANVNQQKLIEGLKRNGNGNTISLKKFKELYINLPYYEHSDSVGLVKNIYMFGYHYGPLRPEQPEYVNIALGRIITRLNISLSVSEELAKIPDMKYAIRMLNTSRATYVFPAEKSPTGAGNVVSDEYFARTSLSEQPTSFYYYVGPHYAANDKEATQIEIAYGTNLPDLPVFRYEDYPQVKTVQVAICNDPPSVTENRDYRINRNCVYSIGIHLKKKNEQRVRTRNDSLHMWEIELE